MEETTVATSDAIAIKANQKNTDSILMVSLPQREYLKFKQKALAS